MALPATGLFEFRATATAGNLNSGGFNPSNANFLTDLTTDADTGNTSSPVVSSASYNFVAGDVGAWVYVKSGTNWYPSVWYQISSVASNKATLNATIGAGVTNTTGSFCATTVTGVASVATPTGGTFGIDFSQQDTAKLVITDLVIDAVTDTNVTSVLTPFHVAYVGNYIHTTAGTGFSQGWFEVVSVSGVIATLDRDSGNISSTGGTSKLGGALSLNSTLDDDFFEAVIGGNQVFFKNGSYTLGEAVSVASASATEANPIFYTGYNTLRGDNPLTSSCPVIACAALAFSLAQFKIISNFVITGTGTSVLAFSADSFLRNVKIINTSTTANRDCFSASGSGVSAYGCEFVSQNGEAYAPGGSGGHLTRCYIHDSAGGFIGVSGGSHCYFNSCLFESIRGIGLQLGGSQYFEVHNCTFYGRESKIGTGIQIENAIAPVHIIDNIFYGLTTGITQLTAQQKSNTGFRNNFYNNTTDVSNFYKSEEDTALDPQFTGATQITGTTATSAGSVLTQSGGDFTDVVVNESYLHVLSGTGVTVGGYLIMAKDVGAGTVTVNNALGTSSAGDIVYYVTTGHNFQIGTNLKANSSHTFNATTISYLDTGAVQREEVASSGGGICVFIS